MLLGYLLAFREGFEAALLIGMVLGVLRRMRRSDLVAAVWQGVGAATAVSVFGAAAFLTLGLSLEGRMENFFAGTTMLLAALAVTGMLLWMFRRASILPPSLENYIQTAARRQGRKAIFGVAFVSVLREGTELAFFSVAAVFASTPTGALLGALFGLATAFLLGRLWFTTTLRLDLHCFFRVSGVLLTLLAAGLVAQSIHEFNAIGWIPAIVDPIWNTNGLLNAHSFVGEALGAFFGYNSRPSLSEVLAYGIYFISVVWEVRRLKTAPTTRSAQPPSSTDISLP